MTDRIAPEELDRIRLEAFLDGGSAAALRLRLLDEIAALRGERDQLDEILQKEAWLEHASINDLPGPYVPWDTYIRERDSERIRTRNWKHVAHMLRARYKVKLAARDTYIRWINNHRRSERERAAEIMAALQASLAALYARRAARWKRVAKIHRAHTHRNIKSFAEQAAPAFALAARLARELQEARDEIRALRRDQYLD